MPTFLKQYFWDISHGNSELMWLWCDPPRFPQGHGSGHIKLMWLQFPTVFFLLSHSFLQPSPSFCSPRVPQVQTVQCRLASILERWFHRRCDCKPTISGVAKGCKRCRKISAHASRVVPASHALICLWCNIHTFSKHEHKIRLPPPRKTSLQT